MTNIDTSSRKEQRNFGLVMAVCFAVLGTIRWAWHGFAAPPTWLYGIAAVFLVLALIAPKILQPVLIVWLKFALALNWVMTRVLLTLAFVTMMLPAGIILRLRGKDPLNRAWDPQASTYWEEAEEQPEELERYLNQF